MMRALIRSRSFRHGFLGAAAAMVLFFAIGAIFKQLSPTSSGGRGGGSSLAVVVGAGDAVADMGGGGRSGRGRWEE